MSQINYTEITHLAVLFFVPSIMNSLVIVLFLSGMVAMIMLRTLHKDIARYNQMDSVVSTCLCGWKQHEVLWSENGSSNFIFTATIN